MFFITVVCVLLAMKLTKPLVPKYTHVNTEYGQQTRIHPFAQYIIQHHPTTSNNIIQQADNGPHPSRKYSNNSAPIAMNMSYWNNFIPDWLSKGHSVDLDEASNPIANHTILLSNFSATNSQSACPKFFRAYIKDPKPFYQICDIVECVIEARDCDDIKLTSGGDYIWAWLKTEALNASQTVDGNITDMGNGEYVARFVLRWAGELTPVIAVVRTRKHVNFLREWREQVPYRFCYSGTFVYNNTEVSTPCHTTPWMDLSYTDVKMNRIRRLCNFTDETTGIPWFCIRPNDDSIPCSAFSWVKSEISRSNLLDISDRYINNNKTLAEKLVNIVPRVISVHGSTLNTHFSRCDDVMHSRECKPDVIARIQSTLTASGFYYKDNWISLQCENKQFNNNDIIQVLQNKTVYMLGDSTLRQWFHYLRDRLGSNKRVTPLIGAEQSVRDEANDISLLFAFHGWPVRGPHSVVTRFHYIANRLDVLPGGRNVVVCITVWGHFKANTMDFYHQRLISIKNALLRYLTRYPDTHVFIKSANTNNENAAIDLSNWYGWTMNNMMKEILGSIPGVIFVDVFDMTIGHKTGYRVHVHSPILRNEVEMMLSFLSSV